MNAELRHDFRLLWTSNAINRVGAAVETSAVPLVAVFVLNGSALQLGVLSACGTGAFLLLGLPIGAWVDRARRRRVMQVANLLRATLLLSLPVAAWLGLLNFAQLLVVSIAGGVLTVFFDVAAPAYLPSLVGKQDLAHYNSKIYSTQALAYSAGPALSGILAQLTGAVNAIVVSILSFLGSSGLLALIRTRESRPQKAPATHLIAEVLEGLRYVFGDRLLRFTLACTATVTFFRSVAMAVLVLFLARTLGLSPLWVGITLAVFGIGGACGSLTVTRWFRAFGELRTMWLVLLGSQPCLALVALAGRDWRIGLAILGGLCFGYGGQVFNVAQISLRQQLCEDRLMGRMNASVRFVTWGVMPFGALAGGALGEMIGLRATLWVATFGGLGAVCWLLASPARTLHRLDQVPT